MDAIIVTKASAKEIATLALAVQGQQDDPEREMPESEREQLIHRYESDIRQYEQRLAKLKSGASPGDVVFGMIAQERLQTERAGA